MRELHEIDRPQVCIVHLKSDEGLVRPSAFQGCVYYQVTVDPEQFSPGGFVRFGNCQGDELHGWMPAENIIIDEILDELEAAPYVPGYQPKAIKAA